MDGKWTSWNKRVKKTRIGDFHKWNNLAGCSRACGATRVHVPAQRFLRKLKVILGFALISLFSILAASSLHLSSFSLSLYFSTLFLRQETRVELLEICDLILCKGRRLHLSHHRKDYPKPSFFYLFY